MGSLSPWVKLLRFEEYGPLFVLCGLAGSLYAGVASYYGLAALLAFVGSFSASAFVLNDITDRQEDSLSSGTRNPLATGELGVSSGVALFVLLAAASVASLYFVAPPALYVAPLVYGLYWGYSWGPGFKARPGLDIAVHGAVPALFVFMGYLLFRPPSLGAALLAGVVFCMAAMSGVVQEVRDMGRDSASRRTTAIVLGERRAVGLALASLVGGVALYSVAAATGGIPLAMLALVPFAWFLVSPLLGLRRGELEAAEAIRSVRGRGLVLAGCAMLVFLAAAAAA